MANGRFISRTIATDKRLSQLSIEAEYLFLKTLPHLDRDGLILADVLWATVTPRRPAMAAIIDDLCLEWYRTGLAVSYETDEGTIIYFPGFAKNQQGMRYDREGPSRYAPPPGMVRSAIGLTPDQLRTNSGLTPAQGQGQGQDQGQDQRQGETLQQRSGNVTETQPLESSSSLSESVKAWETNIGIISYQVGEDLKVLTAEYPPAWVPAAITKAKGTDKPMAYVRKVLKNWRNGDGVPNGNGAKPQAVSLPPGYTLPALPDEWTP